MIRYYCNLSEMPVKFPTHKHDAIFWESLGRAVATYGFLEEILGKAIFVFTATRPYDEQEIDAAYEKWEKKLPHILYDSLGSLIDSYEDAVRSNPDSVVENLNELLTRLRKGKEYRDVLCHGSWRAPDKNGASIPLFVNKKLKFFDTPINSAFIDQVQLGTSELICDIVNSVTQMGWQFPGSNGPGKKILI